MRPLHTRIADRHKNNKFRYYIRAFSRLLIPAQLFRAQLKHKLNRLNTPDCAYILNRVHYYNRLSEQQHLSENSVSLCRFKIPKTLKVYFFDLHEYTRFFCPSLRINFLFGDITHIPQEAAVVKSRPISTYNTNSILLNLNKLRHFTFIRDNKSFESKKNMLIGRAVVKVPHRIRFYELYFNHPMCDLGQVNTDRNTHWVKNFLTIDEHLDYKFILCIEGYDVASNLKWVMSSNSLAVMPKPKFETWFMEGTLIPNYHYVLIKDDYSDVEERMSYYIRHPQEAQQIIDHANAYVRQFRNKEREDLISLLVLEKYFYKTGQLTPQDCSLYNTP